MAMSMRLRPCPSCPTTPDDRDDENNYDITAKGNNYNVDNNDNSLGSE